MLKRPRDIRLDEYVEVSDKPMGPMDYYKAKVEADKTAAMESLLDKTATSLKSPWLVTPPMGREMTGSIPYDELTFDRTRAGSISSTAGTSCTGWRLAAV